MTEWKARRFWTAVEVIEVPDGHEIRLDARPIKTPQKSDLTLPSRALAEGIAAEWNAQAEVIDPLSMPLTRAANSAIDKVAPQHEAVARELAGYGATDLLCYRAAGPESLVTRQAELWDPLLAWAAETYGAALRTTEGVMPAVQDDDALERLTQRVLDTPIWEMAALSEFVTLSGSLVLGLAVLEQAHPAETIWPLSRLDETWQQEQWGEDEEDAERVAIHRAAFLQAERYLTLVRAA